MTTYAWPGFKVSHFEMRVQPNLRGFASPFSNDYQAVNLLGEKLVAVVALPSTGSVTEGQQREAFFDRLQGQVHRIAIGNLRRPLPLGTMRGTPTLSATVAQLANTATIQTTAGATLLAGDMFNFGGAQLVRVMADATANGSGLMTVEFAPRARQSYPASTAIQWSAPTGTFMLKPGTDNVPTVWTPDGVEGCSFELIEAP
jgi:hypothetical protein